MTAADPPPLDARAYAILAEAGLGSDVFNPRQHRCCELVERYALQLAIELVDRLGLGATLVTPQRLDDVVAARGFVPAFRPALRWLLDRLAGAGLGVAEGGRYRLPAPLPPSDREAIRATTLATDPAYAPALALLDEAAALYPRVAAGEVSGERALFRHVALWVAYFSNANPFYALNNRVSARAAADRLAPGAAVLEVGAGLGSATEALLDALAAGGMLSAVAAYHVTEPVPFFRRRASRALEADGRGVPFTFGALDLNRPWAAQGADPGRFQLVWGVNVFHLARDLDAVLAEAAAALAPGGWLVVGEGMRPAAGRAVGAELPFQLLESYADVRLDPATRPTPGFLTAEHWTAALARAGLGQIRIVPDVVRLRALYPGLLAGAVCGQKA